MGILQAELAQVEGVCLRGRGRHVHRLAERDVTGDRDDEGKGPCRHRQQEAALGVGHAVDGVATGRYGLDRETLHGRRVIDRSAEFAFEVTRAGSEHEGGRELDGLALDDVDPRRDGRHVTGSRRQHTLLGAGRHTEERKRPGGVRTSARRAGLDRHLGERDGGRPLDLDAPSNGAERLRKREGRECPLHADLEGETRDQVGAMAIEARNERVDALGDLGQGEVAVGVGRGRERGAVQADDDAFGDLPVPIQNLPDEFAPRLNGLGRFRVVGVVCRDALAGNRKDRSECDDNKAFQCVSHHGLPQTARVEYRNATVGPRGRAVKVATHEAGRRPRPH